MKNISEKPRSNKAKTHFNHPNKQEHGTAAGSKGHEDFGFFENKWIMRASVNQLKGSLDSDINYGLDDYYSGMNSEQLEQEADRILRDADENDVRDAHIVSVSDELPTVAEFGKRTKREVRKQLARNATLDIYEHDDFGDYDGDSHIRITNRPR